MLIFGALLYATIFGNVTTIIQQIYAGKYSTRIIPGKSLSRLNCGARDDYLLERRFSLNQFKTVSFGGFEPDFELLQA